MDNEERRVTKSSILLEFVEENSPSKVVELLDDQQADKLINFMNRAQEKGLVAPLPDFGYDRDFPDLISDSCMGEI